MKVTIQDTRTSVIVRPRDFKVTVSGARGPQGPAGVNEWGEITGDIIDQTDLYNALQAKVPYTGATQDVNLGEYGAQLGNLEFDNTPTNVPTTAGSVYWNDTDGTLNIVLKGGQTISRVGETQHIRALNNTGAQIARGKVVYVVGAQGQRLTIALADADTEILSKDTIGFTSEAIADGAEGFVIVQGVINNVNTNGMTDGATVYLSQTAGSYTTTPPSDPAHLVILGFIVNGGSGGAGSIYVKVDNGYELEELHNISDSAKTTPVGDDALLLRDSADNNLWKRLTWTNALAGVKSHMDTFKSVAGGYASLDGSGKVPASELPSYVDDVVEVANYAALPGTGETGKIYVTLDTNKCYRWSGSVYVQVAQGVDTLTTTGTSGAATLVGSTLNIPQYQGVLTNPVTGTGTAGQVAYFNGTSAVTGSANLFWDNTNGRLGIGTASPSIALQIERSSNGSESIWIRNTNTGASAFGAVVAASYGVSPSTTGTIELRSHNFNHSVWPSTGMLVANSSLTNGLSIFATAGNITFNTTSGGTERARIESGGNFVIGTTSASARLHVRGSGTTSATTALLVQNSGATELFSVRDNNWISVGSNNITFYPFTNIGTSTPAGKGLAIGHNYSGAPGTGIVLVNPQEGNRTATSGDSILIRMVEGFAPTSGTGTFISTWISPTINQTGGANGITRGLYVNPTLTAAADWRSVEFSNNTGWGIYGAGTANNYLGGGLGIGTTTLTGYNMRMAKAITGSTTSYGVSVESTLNSDVTNAANIYFSSVSTQTAAYTLTSLRHFFATGAGIGGSSVITNQFGYSVSSSMTTATNNYGFYGDIASGTGRWNLYMNGTAANYLAGNTSIGTATSSGRLTVRGSGTTSATNGLLVEDSAGTDTFVVRDDGGFAFKGGTVGVAQTGYTTFTNLTTDRTCNANATTVEELADILGTLIEDLKTKGIIAA